MHRTNDVLAQPGPRATLRLSEVLSALTRAFDITEGMLPGHATRTCYIAMRISEALNLTEEARSHLFSPVATRTMWL